MEAIYQSWDTAITIEETSAWSVCTTWGVSGKFFALLDVYRQRLTYPDLLKAVKTQYAKYKPRLVIVEQASSGIPLIQQLRQEGNNWVAGIKPKGSKQERAMHQAPKIEAERVLIPSRASWADTFLSEIAAFPAGRSDQVDAMTQFLYAFDVGQNHEAFRELKYWQREREKRGY
jgi:predicted phage terminase large subunit-like protein